MAIIQSDESPQPNSGKSSNIAVIVRRISRLVFASRKSRVKRAQGSANAQLVNLRMERNVITAGGNVNVYACDTVCNHQGSDSEVSATCSKTPDAVGRPKFLDKLPQYSRWDIQTEDQILDTGFCRVYAAKVNKRPVILKDFYGERAAKAWAATAKFHAAAHFSPEVQRLLGASDIWQETEDEDGLRSRPFLVLDADDFYISQSIPGVWESFKQTADTRLHELIGLKYLAELADYLASIQISKPLLNTIQLFARPGKYKNFPTARPIVTFHGSGVVDSGKPADRNAILFTLALILFSGPVKTRIAHPLSFGTTVDYTRVSPPEAKFLQDECGLGEFLYPNVFIHRLFTHEPQMRVMFFTIFTRSHGLNLDEHDLIEELTHNGSMTFEEKFDLQMNAANAWGCTGWN